MNCKQIQIRLSARDNEEMLQAQKPDDIVNRHLAKCADCSHFLKQLRRMETALQSPADTAPYPSTELKQRIAARLMESDHAPRFSRPLRSLSRLKEDRKVMRRFSLSFSVAVVTGMVLLIVFTVQQSGRATTALKRMGEAARNVRTVHLIGWNCGLRPSVASAVKQGEQYISFTEVSPRRVEAWISGDKWREAEDFDVTVYSRGKVWLNGELSANEKKPPLLTSFAYKAISGEDPFGAGEPYTLGDMGEKVLDGRRLVTLSVESHKSALSGGAQPINEHRLFWLDPDTYLPVRMEEMRWDVDRWALDAVIWFDYNNPVSDSLFDPAAVKQERHTAINWSDHPARDLYRLSPEQSAKYQAITSEPDTAGTEINANASLTSVQKSAALTEHSRHITERLRQVMNHDQQRLFDDWWYVQPKILDKLATPEQRAEEARWRAEQQRLLDSWYAANGVNRQ